MQIDIIGSDTVKITLNKAEMICYNLRFEKIDCNSPEMKNFVLDLLGIIKARNNIDFNSKKLYIEAFPKKDGGCMIYISPIEEREKPQLFKTKSAYANVITEFEDFSLAVELSKKLVKSYNHIIRSSALYAKDGKYRIVIEIFSKLEPRICNIACEYGASFDKSDISFATTKEHYNCLIKSGAIEAISKL